MIRETRCRPNLIISSSNNSNPRPLPSLTIPDAQFSERIATLQRGFHAIHGDRQLWRRRGLEAETRLDCRLTFWECRV